jgi:hypothetical protein
VDLFGLPDIERLCVALLPLGRFPLPVGACPQPLYHADGHIFVCKKYSLWNLQACAIHFDSRRETKGGILPEPHGILPAAKE